MGREEFAEKIENGRDILFEVAGKRFAIFTWMDDGIGIVERDVPGSEIQCFDSAEQLIDGFKVHDVPLAQLIRRVKITEYS